MFIKLLLARFCRHAELNKHGKNGFTFPHFCNLLLHKTFGEHLEVVFQFEHKQVIL